MGIDIRRKDEGCRSGERFVGILGEEEDKKVINEVMGGWVGSK